MRWFGWDKKYALLPVLSCKIYLISSRYINNDKVEGVKSFMSIFNNAIYFGMHFKRFLQRVCLCVPLCLLNFWFFCAIHGKLESFHLYYDVTLGFYHDTAVLCVKCFRCLLAPIINLKALRCKPMKLADLAEFNKLAFASGLHMHSVIIVLKTALWIDWIGEWVEEMDLGWNIN